MKSTRLHRILLIENHAVVQAGLEIMLKKSSIPHILEFAETYTEGMDKFHSTPFNLVILDIDGNGTGYSTIIEKIKSLNPDIKILTFSDYEENIFAYPVIQMGANGFVSKSATCREIIDAVKSVLNCETYVSQQVQKQIISDWADHAEPSNPLKSLSARETDVLMLLIEGCSTSDISYRLNLQPSTISTYKNRILKKMAVSNDFELVDKFRIFNELDK